MAVQVIPVAERKTSNVANASNSAVWKERSTWALQISLTLLVIAIVWQLIGAEADTLREHHVRLLLLNAGCIVAIGSWVLGTDWPRYLKVVTFFAGTMSCLLLAVHSSTEFDRSLRVFQPPRIVGQRIVHEAIGLSYERPAEFHLNLKPSMMRKLATNPNRGSNSPRRLLYGEVVMLGQMTKPAEKGKSPTTINVIVGHELNLGVNGIVQEVKQIESLFASSPKNQITRPAHLSRLGHLETVEFELIKTDTGTTSRYVFFRDGEYLINFAYSTDRLSDMPLFEDFLKTVRLDQAR